MTGAAQLHLPSVLADHTFISAVPFLIPALIVIGLVGWHVVRDRRAGEDEDEEWEDVWPPRPPDPPRPPTPPTAP